jgi:hypothetical protein
MKRQPKPTADDLARAIWDSPQPRSQAEWRATSRAMREARRALGQGREFTRTISVRCGSLHRRIDLWGPYMKVYNGPSPVCWIDMIGGYRRRYMEGSKDGRLEGARQFAARSREEGPIRLP